jgi:hypothetical protein
MIYLKVLLLRLMVNKLFGFGTRGVTFIGNSALALEECN